VNRRELLAALGAGTLLSGCLTAGSPEGGSSDGGSPGAERTASGTDASPDTAETVATPTPGTTNAAAEVGLAEFGIPSDVCTEPIAPESGIYAITDPAFGPDWSGVGVDGPYRHNPGRAGLVDEQTVIGLTADGEARAYPLTVLTTHEVVNDTLGGGATDDTAAGTSGEPVLVTYCPICRSGMVARRRVAGDPTLFAVTGLLWKPERVQSVASEDRNRTFGAPATGGQEVPVRHNGNLVLYDAATGSYWSQILARAICGPRTGTELAVRPSTVATWREWRDRYPDTEVLLPPPHSGTVGPGETLGVTNPDG
jgi:hypothetical protein